MSKMIYTIKPENNNITDLKQILERHPEIQFVSFMGIDIGGNGTDEKIPIKLFIRESISKVKKCFLKIIN